LYWIWPNVKFIVFWIECFPGDGIEKMNYFERTETFRGLEVKDLDLFRGSGFFRGIEVEELDQF